jgi:hypothetical protein
LSLRSQRESSSLTGTLRVHVVPGFALGHFSQALIAFREVYPKDGVLRLKRGHMKIAMSLARQAQGNKALNEETALLPSTSRWAPTG